MLKNQKTQKGFTIVELLIVIVVIGILAALVLNTFSGVQARARDSQRQTDTNSLATQLEVFYNDKGGYPTFAQINDTTKATTLLKGIDEQALIAPQKDTFSLQAIASSDDKGVYGYYPLDAAGLLCSVDNDCKSFTLSYKKESGDPATLKVSKKSLNK